MKIAIVIPNSLSALLFCKGMINNMKSVDGYDIHIICQEDIHADKLRELGVNIINLDMYRFISPIRDTLYLVKLYKIIKREGFDVVLNFSTKPNIYGPIAAKMANVKTIISHIVGLGATFLPNNGIKSILLQNILLRLYHISCKLCDKVWFTNPNDLNLFISWDIINKKKVVLTNNYLDVDYYSSTTVDSTSIFGLKKELDIRDKDRVVIMVARMIWSKGIKEFAEASEILKDKHPHIKFLLVAPLEPNALDSVPESYIRQIEQKSNLKWLGFRSDVKSLYALSDLAVLPSYYKEGGYPRALTEPMAMGKPIITTESEDCRGTVEEGKNGYLVPVKDSKALAAAISSLIEDNDKLLEFGKYSRLKAERGFDEKKIVPQALRECGVLPLGNG
jgi:N,N'-diacetylbacillosaminyl-diphospho-undecaprenol alpha-1,3-N-acetylgalactosaminyltransferase